VGWALLAIIFGSLGALLLIVLFRIADEEDRSARRVQRRMDPYSDVTVTRYQR